MQQESERRTGEQSTQPSLILWESVAGGHQEDVTCLATSRIWAIGDFLPVPSPVPEMYILPNFHSGSSCQECSPGRTELLRPSGWAIWLNPIKYKVYDSGGPVERSTLLPMSETNQVYSGLDKNFVWLVNMLFNKVLGEKNVYYLKSNELFGQSNRFPCFLTCHLPIWSVCLVLWSLPALWFQILPLNPPPPPPSATGNFWNLEPKESFCCWSLGK